MFETDPEPGLHNKNYIPIGAFADLVADVVHVHVFKHCKAFDPRGGRQHLGSKRGLDGRIWPYVGLQLLAMPLASTTTTTTTLLLLVEEMLMMMYLLDMPGRMRMAHSGKTSVGIGDDNNFLKVA